MVCAGLPCSLHILLASCACTHGGLCAAFLKQRASGCPACGWKVGSEARKSPHPLSTFDCCGFKCTWSHGVTTGSCEAGGAASWGWAGRVVRHLSCGPGELRWGTFMPCASPDLSAFLAGHHPYAKQVGGPMVSCWCCTHARSCTSFIP